MAQSLFSSGFLRLEAAMSAREKVQNVYASNIANADTPNYHADTRSFADFFAQQKGATGLGELAKTHSKHLDVSGSSGSLGGVFHRSSEALRMDGNTVDTRKEMTAMAENQMMHEMNMQILKDSLTGMSNVIKEGSR